MKQFYLVFIAISITLLSCDKPDCTNTNSIFNKYSPTSLEYKKELVAQLQNKNLNELSFWFDEYVEESGKDYLKFLIQGDGICAKGLMKVDKWTDEIANIKRAKGKSYKGAEFKGLVFSINQESENIEFVYQYFDRIID